MSNARERRVMHRMAADAAFTLMGTSAVMAQSPIRDLYIEAAAVAEKCGVPPLDAAATVGLAAVISGETKEPLSGTEAAQLLAKARAAMSAGVDCNGPFTSIHVQFFKNVVQPRIDAQSGAKPPP